MSIPCDGVESDQEEGNAKFDLASVNGGDSDYPEESVEEVNEPGTSRGRGCGRLSLVGAATSIIVVATKVLCVV